MAKTTQQQKVDRPSYSPRCLRRLEKHLGLSDSMVEWVEVAIRKLKLGVEGNWDPQAIAQEVDVRVSNIPLDDVHRRWAELQIVSVCQFVDEFLSSLKAEVPRPWGKKRDDEDHLAFLIRSLGRKKSDVGPLEVELVQYYRSIRNRLMHAPSSPQQGNDIKKAEKLRERVRESRYGRLNAPNKLAELSFDDFVLYSRAAKDLSRRLCHLAAPTADELSLVLKASGELQAALRKFRGNEGRQGRFVKSYLCTHLGFGQALAQARVVELQRHGLLVQWSERPPPSVSDGVLRG